MSKRKCIFTGEDSDFKLNIAHEDHHNWAKYIPTSKVYYESYLKHRPLNELEMRQIELFFQLELCKVKQLKLIDRMESIKNQILEGLDSFQTVEQLHFYKSDIQFNQEKEQEIIVVDEPKEPLDIEKISKTIEISNSNEKKITKFSTKEDEELTEEKKEDTIAKKVIKKKPKLWD